MAKIVKENEFNKEIERGVVVVDFFATWCGPCKMLAPVFDEVSSELEGKANFIKVDVDQSSSIASQYGVTSIPTIVVLKDGEKQQVSLGFQPKQQLKSMVEQYV